MQEIELLPSLHALLTAEHVTRAAEQMHLSVPAMSRTLARCRRVFGDPLLVRRGRGVVITARGRELRDAIEPLLTAASALFAAAPSFDARTLRRMFSIRANEAVIAALGSDLSDIVGAAAPHASIRFESESADDLEALRENRVDLAIGAYSESTRELRAEHLATETLVGVMRSDHPLASVRMTLRRFASVDHVVTSRRGHARGPLDDFLADHGLERRVTAVVPSFAAAIAICAQSDSVTVAPRRLAAVLARGASLVMFDPPVPLPTVDVVALWHDRHTTDPVHEWLRECVQTAASRLALTSSASARR